MKTKPLTIALIIALAFSLAFAIWLGIANRKMRHNLSNYADQQQAWSLRESAYIANQIELQARSHAIKDSLAALNNHISNLESELLKTQNYEANTRKHVNSLSADSLLNSIHTRYARSNTN